MKWINRKYKSTVEECVTEMIESITDPITRYTEQDAREDLELLKFWYPAVDITLEDVHGLMSAWIDEVDTRDGDTISFSAALALMNDDICSRLNAELAPCDNQTFYDAYCREHLDVYGEEFIPDIGGAW